MFLQGNGTVTFQPGSGQTQTFADAIADQTGSGGTGLNAGSWNLTLNGPGTLTLAGSNSYSGATTVSAGTLLVTGSIAASSGVTVNAGGALGGTGIVSAISVNSGGTLMPGLPAVVGTLQATSVTFASGASYLITINGASNSKVTATGAAAPNSGATVGVASGSTINLNQRYTILTATGGVIGQFDPNVMFGALKGTLSYDANDVFLTFNFTGIAPLLPPGAPINVVNVANAIDKFFVGGPSLPPGFQTVAMLPQSQLENALTQLSGELGTGAQLSAFQLMNEFMTLLLDPLADGHGAGIGPLPFAPAGQQNTFTPEVANAYASVLKAPAAPITVYGPWRAWGAAFGGSNSITGDPAIVGSHDVRTTAGGFAAGLDYRFSPDTVVGVALAGAATGWDLSAGLGSGQSDAFLAGLYAKHQFGPAYLSGALAFANHWASTTRTVTVAGTDTLKASFDAQSFGGRLEGGYRVSLAPVTVTPYAALQAQSFRLPGYSETAASGSPQFALSYAAQTSTATRGELGAWLSRNLLLARGDTLALFGRAAWARDWFSNLAVTPTFLGLPGASFVVNGAAPPHDVALVTAGAEWRLRSNWSLMGRFDGEFGDGQQTYTGTARVRYAW
jgi:outer membrane autotransporter protein